MKVRALHLMRHGAVEGGGRMLGHGDAAPTAEGLAAARARAGDLVMGRVIASDLARARMAGEQIAAEHGLPLMLDPRWRELDFGGWDGCDPARLGEAAARFWDDPEHCAPPGGERWSQLCARVGEGLAAIRGDALVITHAGAIRAALALLLGLDYRQTWAFHLPYAALVSLRIWPDGAMITGLSS